MAIPTWVDTVFFAGGTEDITQYGRDKTGWTSTIGSTSMVQTGFIANAGTYQQTLSNRDRRFDPLFASGPYAGDVLPYVGFGKSAEWDGTFPVFWGRVDVWPQSYPGSGVDQITDLRVTDAIRDFAEAAQVSLTRPAEYTGARIAAVLQEMGWAGATDIAHGDAIVGPIRRRQGSISGWSHITDCVNAEWGEFYIDPDPVGSVLGSTAVFRDRDTIFGSTRSTVSQATFSDTSTKKYADIQLANLPIVNDCTITYGTRGRSVNYNDPTSIAAYGGTPRSLPLTLILTDRSSAQQYARWVVERYKDPITTVASVTIKPGANPDIYFPEILGRKLCDLITVVRTPKVNGVASTPISVDAWIRGISHTYSDHVWQSTTFYLQDASWVTGLFQLDVSELDGPDVLAR